MVQTEIFGSLKRTVAADERIIVPFVWLLLKTHALGVGAVLLVCMELPLVSKRLSTRPRGAQLQRIDPTDLLAAALSVR